MKSAGKLAVGETGINKGKLETFSGYKYQYN